MFRNLTAHRLPADAIPTPEALAEAISARPLQPPGPLELHTVGFVSPRGRSHDVAPVTLDHDTLLSVGTWSRILPTQVINDAIDEKLDKLEAERGRRPLRAERSRIRDEVINELMPRAFLKSGRVDAWLDHSTGLFVVDSASQPAVTSVVSLLREVLGSFPATPLAGGTSGSVARIVLTSWLGAAPPLPDFAAGDECELRDPADDGAIVRCRRQMLDADEIAEHVNAGKQCTVLALNNDRLAFTLDDSLVMRKVRPLDWFDELRASQAERDDYDPLLSDFALMTGELRALYGQLARAFDLDFDVLHLDGNPA